MRDKDNLRTRGPHGLDSIVVGYYRGKELVYVARVRNGFVPASRRQLFEKLKPLVIPECPFVNLPEKKQSGWGLGLTAEDMKDPGSRGQKRIQAGCEMKQPSPVVVGMSYTDCRTHAWLKILRFFPSIFGQNSLG